jgi:hypothetical protein
MGTPPGLVTKIDIGGIIYNLSFHKSLSNLISILNRSTEDIQVNAF